MPPLAMIVEDNVLNRKLLRDILEMQFEVVESETAEEAEESLATIAPKIIFLDVQLPSMDGLTLTRRLRKHPATAKIPIIAVSAHAMQENIDQALAAGCTEYVTKPIVEDPIAFAQRMAKLVQTD